MRVHVNVVPDDQNETSLCVSPFQRLYIPVNLRRSSFWAFTLQYAFIYVGSLVVITGLSFFLLGSWDFIPSVYGFMSVSSHTSHFSQILIQKSTVCVCVFSTDFLFQTSLQTSDSSGTSSQRCLSTSVSFSSASSRSMSFYTIPLSVKLK